jgi:hypothetical protein
MSIPKYSIKIKGIEAILAAGILVGIIAAGSGGIVLYRLFSAQKGSVLAHSRLYNTLIEPGSMAPQFTIIASKTGKKYYASTCGGAKRIKPENTVTFPSREAAETRGYTPAANCSDLEVPKNPQHETVKID